MKAAVFPDLSAIGRLLALILAVLAVLTISPPQRMHVTMLQMQPMAHMDDRGHRDHSEPMRAADATAKGAGYLPCEILCLGTLVEGGALLVMGPTVLLALAFAPLTPRAVKAQSPDPGLRPPNLL